MSKLEIAFLGMGIMGSSMAVNLVKGGHSVTVWNRTKDKPAAKSAVDAGARLADSIGDAVEKARVIVTCLGDVEDVSQVLTGEGGVSESASAGAYVIDTTTIGPAAAKDLGLKLAAAGLRFLDAPITGGDVGARDGTLTIMVGGDADDFRFVEPVLECMGKRIELCGPVGSGQALKLCNQILCAVNMVGVCEALSLASDLGIERKLVVETLGGGAGGSWALTNLGKRIVDNDLAPGFMLKHMIKDLRLVGENMCSDELELPGTRLAESLFKDVAQEDKSADVKYGTHAMIRSYAGQAGKVRSS